MARSGARVPGKCFWVPTIFECKFLMNLITADTVRVSPPLGVSTPLNWMLKNDKAVVDPGGHAVFGKLFCQQECIPVGCVPSATVAVCWGVPAQEGSAPGGCLLLERGGGIPACTEADPHHVDRMTDRCKNITFATSLRTVKIRSRLLTPGKSWICHYKVDHHS